MIFPLLHTSRVRCILLGVSFPGKLSAQGFLYFYIVVMSGNILQKAASYEKAKGGNMIDENTLKILFHLKNGHQGSISPTFYVQLLRM